MREQLLASDTPLPLVQIPARQLWLAAAFVFSVTLIAWAPMCSLYVPVVDDMVLRHLLDHGIGWYARENLRAHGAWRYLGLLMMSAGARHTALYGPVAVLAHATVSVLYLFTCCRLLGNLSVSLILTVFFAAFPMAAGAVSWAAAGNLVAMEALFLLALLIFCRFGFERRYRLPCLLASFLVTLLAQFVQENLLFAFAALGTMVWISGKGKGSLARNIREVVVSRYCGFGPMLGVLVFLVCYKLLPATAPIKKVIFHPASAISPLLRQYALLWFAGLWRSSTTRELLFWGWHWWMTVLAAIAGAGATWALVGLVRTPAALPSAGGDAAGASRPSPSLLGYLLVLLLGASAIYAAAGGYSLDSRKRYPLLPIMLWIAGWIWCYALSRGRAAARPRAVRWSAIPITLAAVIGIPSTWLYLDVWRYECHRQQLMVDFCLRHHVTGPVQIQWVPDIYQAWPHAASDWQFRLDEQWVLDLTFEGLGHQHLISAPGGAPVILRYDPKSDAWEMRPSTGP